MTAAGKAEEHHHLGNRLKGGGHGIFAFSEFGGLKQAIPQLALSTLLFNLLALALPFSLLQVYDRIVPNSSVGTLSILIGGIMVALFLESLIRMARSNVTGWIGAKFEHNAGFAAFDHLLHAELADFDRSGSGEHLERLNALRKIREFYAGQLITVFLDLPFVFLFLGLVALLGGHLVWVPLGMLILFTIATVWKSHAIREAIANHTQARDRRLNFSIEVLRGIHTVKAMGMENQMLARFSRLQEGVAKSDCKVAEENAATMSVSGLFAQATMIVVAAVGSTFVIDNLMTVGGLAACSLLSGRALQPLQRAVGLWTRFQSVGLSRDQVLEIFALRREQTEGAPIKSSANIDGHISLQNLSFAYPTSSEAVLNGINLEVPTGTCIGIKGDNSSGKTTLLRLMMGSLTPTSGAVRIDGHNVLDFDSKALRFGGISYLPQEGELVRGTILENITMFRPNTEHDAQAIAGELGLDEIVANTPFGYAMNIGDGASDGLPRGIKQRIAIARALVSDPRIILFDEANSAVDGPGDAKIRELLEKIKGKRTMILVSQRPSLLDMADAVYEIVDGRLVHRPQEPKAPAPEAPAPAPAPTPAPAAGPAAAPKPVAAPRPTVASPAAPTASQPANSRARPRIMRHPESKQVEPKAEPGMVARPNTPAQASEKSSTSSRPSVNPEPRPRPSNGQASAANRPAPRPTVKAPAPSAPENVLRPRQAPSNAVKPAATNAAAPNATSPKKAPKPPVIRRRAPAPSQSVEEQSV
ncbi:MAG: ABC transporter transmembrane domain-containing protein [Magnetovibrionaceae bacterium]